MIDRFSDLFKLLHRISFHFLLILHRNKYSAFGIFYFRQEFEFHRFIRFVTDIRANPDYRGFALMRCQIRCRRKYTVPVNMYRRLSHQPDITIYTSAKHMFTRPGRYIGFPNIIYAYGNHIISHADC